MTEGWLMCGWKRPEGEHRTNAMNSQRLAIALTMVNLLILLSILSPVSPVLAGEVTRVLRGRALEIVDDHGKLRAQIIIQPASTTADGKTYRESVLFRLIDPNGRPGVKIGTSEDGSGISLAGDSQRREWSGVRIPAQGMGSSPKLTNKDGREQLLRP